MALKSSSAGPTPSKSERGDQDRVGFAEAEPQALIRRDAVEQLQRQVENQQPVEMRVHVLSLHGARIESTL